MTRTIDATTRLNLTGATASLGESGGNVGFYGSAGALKGQVTGNLDPATTTTSILAQTLKDLLQALDAVGLIVDSTTT